MKSAAGCQSPMRSVIFFIRYAFKAGLTVEEIHDLTEIDPWFLRNIRDLVAIEDEIRQVQRLGDASGGPDPQGEAERLLRPSARPSGGTRLKPKFASAARALGIEATFKQVDTCAAEFEAYTPYYYSTYEARGRNAAQPGRQTRS